MSETQNKQISLNNCQSTSEGSAYINSSINNLLSQMSTINITMDELVNDNKNNKQVILSLQEELMTTKLLLQNSIDKNNMIQQKYLQDINALRNENIILKSNINVLVENIKQLELNNANKSDESLINLISEQIDFNINTRVVDKLNILNNKQSLSCIQIQQLQSALSAHIVEYDNFNKSVEKSKKDNMISIKHLTELLNTTLIPAEPIPNFRDDYLYNGLMSFDELKEALSFRNYKSVMYIFKKYFLPKKNIKTNGKNKFQYYNNNQWNDDMFASHIFKTLIDVCTDSFTSINTSLHYDMNTTALEDNQDFINSLYYVSKDMKKSIMSELKKELLDSGNIL